MKAGLRVTLLGLVVGSSLLAYNNCSQSLPQEAAQHSSSTGNTSSVPALFASVQPSSVYSDESANVTPSGGVPPYTYQVTSGTANVNTNGLISGPFALGNVIVQVRDAANQTITLAIDVSTRPTSPVVQKPCSTPWGETIQHGQSITAFQSDQIFCPSTAQCASQTRTCNDGVLSGSYSAKTCALRACVFKKTITTADLISTNIICQASYNDNIGTSYGVPLIPSSQTLPTSCTVAQYKNAKYCLIETQNLGGDNGSITMASVYECRGQLETVVAMPYQYVSNEGGGGN